MATIERRQRGGRRSPVRWRVRWRHEDRVARGATATVAEVLASAPDDEATETIQGRVVRLSGSSKGAWAGVDDGTGVIDVFCPAQVCVYGPVVRREFEFDVVPSSGDYVPRPRPMAVARAVRPLD